MALIMTYFNDQINKITRKICINLIFKIDIPVPTPFLAKSPFYTNLLFVISV